MTLGTSTYGFDEFLADLSSMNANPSDTIFSYLSKTDTAKLKMLLKRLERVRSFDSAALAKSRSADPKRKCTKKQMDGRLAGVVGKLLEMAIRVLLDGCKCITHGGNVRTSTSEIDFLLLMNSLASAVPMLRKADAHALGEAKCYASGLKSEWVNELVGLMQSHSATHSILFLAAPPKKLRVDHRHLFHSHSLRGSIVVPFGMTQLTDVASGKNFLKVLNEQYVETITGATNLGI